MILAGGKSSRMESPKPWLKLNDGSSFLEHLVNLYYNLGLQNIAVVLNHEYHSSKWEEQIKIAGQHSLILLNNQVEKGRLFSIRLGLENMAKTDFVYIQNIDNPLIDKIVIEKMSHHAIHNDVIIPAFNGTGGHPVLISKKVVASIKNYYKPSDTLRDVINRFNKKYVDVESKSILVNLNTHSDYIKAMSELN